MRKVLQIPTIPISHKQYILLKEEDEEEQKIGGERGLSLSSHQNTPWETLYNFNNHKMWSNPSIIFLVYSFKYQNP